MQAYMCSTIRTALVVFILLAMVAAQPGAEELPTVEPEDAAAVTVAPASEADAIPLDDIRVLVEVFHKIKRDYVEPISDKDLLENAVRGMLAGLDPHSSYLDPEGYESLQQGTTGEFGGLGIEVGMDEGFLKVISPIDDTPAQRAGIQAGDVIIRLDETPVKGMSLNTAVKKMRGKAGSKIKITIVREGDDSTHDFTIVRDVIQIQSVKSRFLEPGIGYLRISHFQSRTGDDVEKHLKDFRQKAPGGLKGLVLDLRNNPGGVLGAAVSVSDAFLNSGRIVYTEGRAQDAELEFTAKDPDLINGAPLIVLVNEGSASASEIVAGALQDQKRAVIMGRRSFGKGSVQTILPMNNDAALKLTTARYYTPSGRSIQAEGIVPDIQIDKLTVSPIAAATSAIVKEANLTGHLENGNGNGDELIEVENDAVDDNANTDPPEDLAVTDFELYEALNLTRAARPRPRVWRPRAPMRGWRQRRRRWWRRPSAGWRPPAPRRPSRPGWHRPTT
jgi:carboxyl-terminal processing protease